MERSHIRRRIRWVPVRGFHAHLHHSQILLTENGAALDARCRQLPLLNNEKKFASSVVLND